MKVLLDSSQYNDIFKSLEDRSLRSVSEKCIDLLNSNKIDVIITSHNLEECLQTKYREVARKRLSGFRLIDNLYAVGDKDAQGPCSIVNLHENEFICSAQMLNPEKERILENVKRNIIFKKISGKRVESSVLLDFEMHYKLAHESWDKDHIRTVASELIDDESIPDISLIQLMRRSARSNEELARMRGKLKQDMITAMEKRGDKSIKRMSAEIAADFITMQEGALPNSPQNAYDALWQVMYALGLDIRIFPLNAKLSEVLLYHTLQGQMSRLHQFQVTQPLMAVNAYHKTPIHYTKQEFHRKRSHLIERGTKNDLCLAMYAPYVDVVFVDKRIHDRFRQISHTNHFFKLYFDKMEKRGDINKLISYLERAISEDSIQLNNSGTFFDETHNEGCGSALKT